LFRKDSRYFAVFSFFGENIGTMSSIAKSLEAGRFCLPTPAGSINYSLFRKAYRRTLTISVRPDGEVRVSAPKLLPDSEIQRFILQKSGWITEKLKEISGHQAKLAVRKYENGQELLFLGKKYPLRVFPGERIKRPEIVFDGSGWQVNVPAGLEKDTAQALIRAGFEKWYKEQAREMFPGRIFHFARLMRLDPQKIAVKTQRRSWGSCSFRHRSVNLNWQLVMAPPATLDYVVVHELAHLAHPNHSSRFWRKVEEIVPEPKTHKLWLKEHRLEMILP